MTLHDHAVAFLRRLLVVLDPPAATPEKSLGEKDREALERLAANLEKQGRRRGMTPWNYARPRKLEDNGDLLYLLDVHGPRGTAEILTRAYADRNKKSK